MSSKFKDLITCAPGRPNYNFKCALVSNIRDKNPRHHSGVCLSGFGSMVTNNKSKQIVRYTWPIAAIERRWNGTKIKEQIGKPVNIGTLRPMLLRFYHLCRDHGMLPKDFTIPKKANNFYLKNIHSLPPSLLYAFIAHLRDVDEEPYFIYNLLTLVENYNLNPWTSYVIASALSVVNSGHHPISIGGNCGLGGRVRISSMFNLRDYFANPHKKDKRTVLTPGTSYISWNAHKNIDACGACYYSGNKGQVMYAVKDILTNIKKVNKALGMEKKKGIAFLDNARDKFDSTLRDRLYGLGWGATPDFYEPWWLMTKMPSKKESQELVEQIKPYLEAYFVKKQSYGPVWDLMLRTKTRYIAEDAKLKRKNFRQAKKSSRYDNLKGVQKL